jgi:lysophospholipase L1-like esterase
MSRWRVLLSILLVALFCTSARAQQVLTFTPFHANGIYQSGEKVGWTVTRSTDAAGPTRFAYDITKNEFEVLKSGMLDLSLGTATLEIVVTEPSMVYVQVTPEGEQPPPADAAQRKPYASVGALTRTDWDGKTLVILGTSQGGQQGLVTAGLNPDRITALLVNEPSGGDTNGELHGRRAAYPNWPATDPKAMQAALYFDTVNFASRIKAPTLASMGFIDRVVPPAGIWIALNQIPAAKEALPMIEANHVHLTPDKVGAFAVRSTDVLSVLLGGAEYKPTPLSLASVSALAPASARAQTPSAPPVAAPPTVAAPPAARGPADPAAAAARAAAVARDWPALAFYQADNTALPAPTKDRPRVVFMGDSITQAWVRQRASFFTDNGYVGRGISGQTSPQMLLRFHQDVVALKPAAVLILAGTNDVAENTGPMTDEQIIDNLMAMVEIAQANKIKVVIGSVTPATSFFWRRDAVPAPRIAALNVKLKAWAATHRLTYADFWAAMSMPDGTMNPANANDTVHPNAVGYGIMEPIAQAAIVKALKAKD